MSVLEIIAEQRLGQKNWRAHTHLREAFRQIELAVKAGNLSKEEKARIASLVELCIAYKNEPDKDERANILRTLEEISLNEPLKLPTTSIEQWEKELLHDNQEFTTAKKKIENRLREFKKKYFSLRAKAGLKTQEEVAKKTGIRRSYIAVIETGDHLPQQKTLQKLAEAFHVDIATLLT